jgi:hypothetical protein
MGLLAIGSVVDRIVGVGQGVLELARKVGVVFGEQDSHGPSISPRCG